MSVSHPIRRLIFVVTAIITAACVGPQGGHREGKSWPTQPEPPTTHLYGQVLSLTSGVPLEGAKVSVEVDSTVTNIDGRYTIGNIRARSVNLIATHEGYDTSRSLIALPDGDLQRVIRLRPTPTQ